MAIYVDKWGGYINDVAKQDFIRCDGTPFSFDKASATNFTHTVNNIQINGGWSAYPLAVMDTDRTMEMSFTSAQFNMDLFEMANDGVATDESYEIYESNLFDVAAGLTITIPYVVEVSTIKIRGLEYTADAAAAGKFTAEADEDSTTVTFATGDVAEGDSVRVGYYRTVTEAHVVSVKSTSTSAKGEAWLTIPVYTDGKDCSASSIKGYVIIRLYRVRVSAQPGFDNSYKTAATNAITMQALNPDRADGKICDFIWVDNVAA